MDGTTVAVATVLPGLFTGSDAISLSGVLSEVTGMLPVVIPVLVSFIAIRKGIGFLRGILQSA